MNHREGFCSETIWDGFAVRPCSGPAGDDGLCGRHRAAKLVKERRNVPQAGWSQPGKESDALLLESKTRRLVVTLTYQLDPPVAVRDALALTAFTASLTDNGELHPPQLTGKTVYRVKKDGTFFEHAAQTLYLVWTDLPEDIRRFVLIALDAAMEEARKPS